MKKINRSSFLKGSAGALGVAALGLMTGCSDNSAASAASSSTPAIESTLPSTYADSIRWDAEYDVAVLGMGFSGIVSALTAANNGASVVILEKCEEGEAGGNSKVCGQMIAYGHGNVEETKKYYNALAGGRHIEPAVADVLANGVANTAEMLERDFGLDSSEFWELDDVPLMQLMSPEYPELEGHETMSLMATHHATNDGYFYRTMKQIVVDNKDSIDVWYASPAVDLIQDPETKTILGVKVERDGKEMNVRALNGVCLCTGGFECNKEMIQHYLNLTNYAPTGGLYNTGDGILMAQRAGADLWHMSVYEGLFGMGGTSYDVGENAHAANISSFLFEKAGSTILVGTDGYRFVDEADMPRHGHLYANGVWENPHFPEKMWMIYDQTQHEYNEANGLIPEQYTGGIMSFNSIEEMAAAIGCKEDVLKQTIADFNSFAKNGYDPKHCRKAEYMRPMDGKKYYAIYLIAGVLNTQGGPKRNENAEVLDTNGNPIPHLYSAGECGGVTVCMYQGGTNVAECFIFGQIAGKNAAAKKDALPAYQPLDAIASTPAQPGDIDDLDAGDSEFETSANQYIGTGSGINGDVVVRVTMDGDKIAEVEVLKQSETVGIGDKAIEVLPEQFVGMSTADSINGVDGVSGATITSNALKEAVINALTLASAN